MKRKIVKRILAIGLVAGMLAGSLVGCGNNNATVEESKPSESVAASESVNKETEVVKGFEHDPNLNEVGVEPIAKEKVTLTIGVEQNANVENFDTNDFTKLLEEMTNVEIEFLEYPANQVEEKIRLAMAGGGKDLPDIIIRRLGDALVSELAENEMIIPLNDYYENCANYITDAYAEVKELDGVDIMSYITEDDGNIYTVPQYNGTLTNPAYARIWVYGPWLEAVGMKADDIKTSEDFYNMLEAFKTQDPNGNGKADEIPALSTDLNTSGVGAALFDALLSTYVYSTRGTVYMYAEDGKATPAFNQEAWKEGIKYLAKLVQNGLIDETSFSTNIDTFKTLMNTEGDQLVGCFANVSPSFISTSHPSNGKWVLLNPLTGPEGVNTVPYAPDEPVGYAYITSNCENPELAFRLLDCIANEKLTISVRWGTEGVNWDYIENLPAEFAGNDYSKTFSGYPAYFVQYKSNWNVLQNSHWANRVPSVRSGRVGGSYNAGAIATVAEGHYNLELAEKLGNYEALKPKEMLTNISYDAETTELANELKAYIHEKLAAWTTGKADIEAEWTGYLAELDNIGLDRYIELIQNSYDNGK